MLLLVRSLILLLFGENPFLVLWLRRIGVC